MDRQIVDPAKYKYTCTTQRTRLATRISKWKEKNTYIAAI